ncbi:hypothetical protein DN069_10710, partial [Streptacidiphilus pinicola]
MSETGNVPHGGQVPGLEPEQVPQPVGFAAEQGPVQGVRPAYTFLDDVDEEEDELLMPGPQGAWNEAARGQEYPQGQPLPPVVPVVPGQPGVAGVEQPGMPGAYEPGAPTHAPAQSEAPAPSWPPMTPPGGEEPQAVVPQPLAPPVIDPLTDPLSSVIASQSAHPVQPVQPLSAEAVPGQPGLPVEPHAGVAEGLPAELYAAQGYPAEDYLAAAMPGLPVEQTPVEQHQPVEPVAQPVDQPVAGPAAQEPQAADQSAADAGQQAAPRRPLHAGPPIPDPSLMTGQVPVRSLADRGPSSHVVNGSIPVGTPPYGVATPGGPGLATLGGAPEYLDQSGAAHAAPTATATATVPVQMPSPESTLGGSPAQVEVFLAPEAEAPAQPVEQAAAEQPAPAEEAPRGPFVMEPVAVAPAQPVTEPAAESATEPTPEAAAQPETATEQPAVAETGQPSEQPASQPQPEVVVPVQGRPADGAPTRIGAPSAGR